MTNTRAFQIIRKHIFKVCKTYTSMGATADTPKKLEPIKMCAGIRDQNTVMGDSRETHRNQERTGNDKQENMAGQGLKSQATRNSLAPPLLINIY